MEQNDTKPRLQGAAAAFLDQRLAAGRVAFPLADLTQATGLSNTAAIRQLTRLAPRVVRVARRHAFFLIVTPEHAAMGGPPVTWWLDDYFGWLGHPYYLALQSAAATYGSNPQALQISQIMTDSPRRPITVGRIRIRFLVKRGIERTPTQPLANAYAPLKVSTPEATAFDLIRYASRIGGVGRALETLVPLLPLMRPENLKTVLAAGEETSTAQRLGYLLERNKNRPLANIIHEWLPKQLLVTPLVPTKIKPTHAPLVARWQILDNSTEARP
jgi:hypothetical protein